MLSTIQAQLKVPKNNRNNFGNYNYRSAEDIVEAVKKIVNPLGYHLILTDEIVMVGSRVYVKATATLTSDKLTYSATGWAREEETKKGMDASQITGAASSYARKYALNGLFSIDDTKDADATNNHKDIEETPVDIACNNVKLINSTEDLELFWNTQPENIKKDKIFINAVKSRKTQLI